MKLNRVLSLLVISIAFVACGDDDEGGTSTFTGNENKNIARYAGLEFPHISSGNSTVITHSTSQYGVTYSLEWDHDLRAQRWTAYYFTSKNNEKNWARERWKKGVNWDGKFWTADPFQKDPDVPAYEQPSVTGEFSGSSYPDKGFSYFQRGHICPSADRLASMDANGQTYYMTNMFPQGENFNEGIWERMESFVRNDWAKNISGKDTLFVVKGGTIDREDYILCRTRSGFIVPRYFYMALLLKRSNGTHQAMAFWVEHLSSDHSNDKLGDYVISIRELEQKTSKHEGRNDGIDFFCNLPDDIENSVETQDLETIKKLWGLTKK